jgi:hypothetical protein
VLARAEKQIEVLGKADAAAGAGSVTEPIAEPDEQDEEIES